MSPFRNIAPYLLPCLAALLWAVLTPAIPARPASANTAAFAQRAENNAASPLAERVNGRRFTATRAFSGAISREDAAVVAETAATDAAMQYLIQLLATLPEVRICSPNLLALAHSCAETQVLLVSRSKRNATVTVTVAFKKTEGAPSMEARAREALINSGRMALYEETVLREKELCRAYDAALRSSGANIPGKDAGAAAIVNELKALRIFKELLPQWAGIWQNPADAREHLQNALVLAPASPLLHNAAGNASLQLGRSQEAVEEQTAAIRAMPSFARAYHSRGAAHLALGHLSSAVSDFSEAIRLSPLTAAYHRDRGMARHLLGETKEMCKDLYKACSLGDCDKLQWAADNAYCPSASFDSY